MTETMQLRWGSESDRGLRRAVNEDSFVAAPPLFLVADGMGGHEAGAQASRAALDGFLPLVGRTSVTVDDVQAAFTRSAQLVGAIESATSAPGTTLAGIAVCAQGETAYWLVLNIGDSRIYRLTGETLEQVSVDHSAVQVRVERGELTAEDAETHPERNVVTRAVGAGSIASPDYWLLPARAVDRFLICSDGLHKELPFAQIGDVLRQEPVPEDAARRLLHEALVHGGRDNITVVVVDARLAESDPDAPTLPAGPPEELDEDTVPRVVAVGGDH